MRVVLGEFDQDTTPTSVLELQTQVDDMRGEEVPALLDALFAAGALDAWSQSISMKKGRPALLLSALCRPQDRGRSEPRHAAAQHKLWLAGAGLGAGSTAPGTCGSTDGFWPHPNQSGVAWKRPSAGQP